MPETSIVIRAFNEARHLPVLFDGLDQQTYRDFEALVVDSGSLDRTRDIAAERGARVVRIKSADFTFGHALNVGIRESAGRFIAIVSAHTRPVDEHWLGRMVGPLRDERVAMVYGRQQGVSESKFGEVLDFERTFGPGPRVLRPPAFFANNANSAVRKDLWREHPFDESLPGLEDIEWAKYWMLAGRQVVYTPDASIFHIHEETWEQVRRRYYREGQAAKWIGVRRRTDLPAEMWRELRSTLADSAEAWRQGVLGGRYREILRFRYEKLLGTVGGIIDGAQMKNPMTRDRLLFDRHYRAVVIQGPGRASIAERELPPLAPGEVLVRVAYQGVCATDLEILDGELGYYKTGMAKYPIVPGHEFSGTVAAVGTRVNSVSPGDRVVVECIQGCSECQSCRSGNPIGCADRREVGVIGRDGGYAEYMVTPVQFLHRIPEGTSLVQACLCEPLAVVLKGLRRLARAWGAAPGPRRCAVVGAGPIGHLTARVLSARGHLVTVFDRRPQRLALLADGRIETSSTLDGLQRFDALVEATGDPDTPLKLLMESGAGATILLLGLPYGRREFSFETLVGFDKSLVGSVGSGPEDFEAALRTLPQIDTAAFQQCVMPMARVEDAWRVSRSGEHLKVILDVGGDGAERARNRRDASAVPDEGAAVVGARVASGS